ncbi:sec-independent protein translocase [Sesbania bispinosa]|nr:sec-independent protein translocase [Sesbania bispinosa]
MPLNRCFDVITCHFVPFRMFQGNLRVHLNGRLVSMTFQVQHKTYNSNFQNTTSTPSSTATTNSSQIAVDPNGTRDPNRAYSSDEYLKITEEQLKAAAAQQQGQTTPLKEGEFEPQIQPPAAKETASTVPPPQKPESETLPQDS